MHYVRRPFQREPDFGVTSVNYQTADWLARAESPAANREAMYGLGDRSASERHSTGEGKPLTDH